MKIKLLQGLIFVNEVGRHPKKYRNRTRARTSDHTIQPFDTKKVLSARNKMKKKTETKRAHKTFTGQRPEQSRTRVHRGVNAGTTCRMSVSGTTLKTAVTLSLTIFFGLVQLPLFTFVICVGKGCDVCVCGKL